MTRINVGIPPKELSQEHLIAEHREIKRIPNVIRQGKANLDLPIPEKFCLGKGHVRFFYNKLGYLYERYLEIRDECYRREFKVTDYSDAWKDLPAELMNSWEPNEEDIQLVKDRIAEKLAAKKEKEVINS